MPDDPNIQIVQQVPKTWKDRGLDFAFNQGPAVLILLAIVGFFGYYIYTEMPKRDTYWQKALSDQTAEFKKILEERDVRNLAYRTVADSKHAEEVKEIMLENEKQYLRLERLMLELQKHGITLEKKVESLMQ